jgi:hypothetical protein
MTFILIFGLLWSLLAVVGLGITLVVVATRSKENHRKREEMRVWAKKQRDLHDPSRVEDEETYIRNQQADIR